MPSIHNDPACVLTGSSTYNERVERLWRDVYWDVTSSFVVATFKALESEQMLDPPQWSWYLLLTLYFHSVCKQMFTWLPRSLEQPCTVDRREHDTTSSICWRDLGLTIVRMKHSKHHLLYQHWSQHLKKLSVCKSLLTNLSHAMYTKWNEKLNYRS